MSMMDKILAANVPMFVGTAILEANDTISVASVPVLAWSYDATNERLVPISTALDTLYPTVTHLRAGPGIAVVVAYSHQSAQGLARAHLTAVLASHGV